jgi:hypothetical protein
MKKQLMCMAITLIITASAHADAEFYRDNNGRWYSYDKKTDTSREVFSTKNISDPRYKERHYPYQLESDYTSFGSDRSYRDQTNRNMGNR